MKLRLKNTTSGLAGSVSARQTAMKIAQPRHTGIILHRNTGAKPFSESTMPGKNNNMFNILKVAAAYLVLVGGCAIVGSISGMIIIELIEHDPKPSTEITFSKEEYVEAFRNGITAGHAVGKAGIPLDRFLAECDKGWKEELEKHESPWTPKKIPTTHEEDTTPEQ
jgi:hypothetical protein